MTVIYCVGESLEQREQGLAEQVVLQQICDIVPVVTVEQWQKQIVIAYEPIWALGQVKPAPQDAQAMHAKIREGLSQITPAGSDIAILYGGSVKAENAVELAACPDINGALVGGASLNAASFYQIVQALHKVNNEDRVCTLLYLIVHIILAVLMIALILVQHGKGADAGAFSAVAEQQLYLVHQVQVTSYSTYLLS